MKHAMVNNQKEVLKLLQEHRDDLHRYDVRSLGLFGSFAEGTNTDSSDVDFVVEFNRKSFDAYMDLKFYLEDLLGRRVDLVLPGTIKPQLRSAILQQTLHAPGL